MAESHGVPWEVPRDAVGCREVPRWDAVGSHGTGIPMGGSTHGWEPMIYPWDSMESPTGSNIDLDVVEISINAPLAFSGCKTNQLENLCGGVCYLACYRLPVSCCDIVYIRYDGAFSVAVVADGLRAGVGPCLVISLRLYRTYHGSETCVRVLLCEQRLYSSCKHDIRILLLRSTIDRDTEDRG